MLKIMILVCSIDLTPAECRPETAADIVAGPPAASILACAMQAQALMAETGIMERSPGMYMKIRCVPPQSFAAAVEANRASR